MTLFCLLNEYTMNVSTCTDISCTGYEVWHDIKAHCFSISNVASLCCPYSMRSKQGFCPVIAIPVCIPFYTYTLSLKCSGMLASCRHSQDLWLKPFSYPTSLPAQDQFCLTLRNLWFYRLQFYIVTKWTYLWKACCHFPIRFLCSMSRKSCQMCLEQSFKFVIVLKPVIFHVACIELTTHIHVSVSDLFPGRMETDGCCSACLCLHIQLKLLLVIELVGWECLCLSFYQLSFHWICDGWWNRSGNCLPTWFMLLSLSVSAFALSPCCL